MTGVIQKEVQGEADTSQEGRLVRHLGATGRVDAETLARAGRIGRSTGERLPGLLLKLGLVSERDLAEALSAVYGLPLVVPADYPEVPLFEAELSPRFLREVHALPLDADAEGIDLAMVDPGDAYVRDAVQLATGRTVRPRIAIPTEIEQAFDRLYGGAAAEPVAEETELGSDEGLETDIERLRDLASEAPVVRLVNRMIAAAIERRASDIHLEPFENRLRLRYRIDGVLTEGDPPPFRQRAAIVSRIKIMARLDIAERRLPQDGRIKTVVRGTPVDLRVSTLPSLYGEGVVLRVLDRESIALDFAALGIDGAALERFLVALDRPNGIFLVTGPTGSGKTTTLYAALSRLNEVGRKIITVEDPVEYQLDGVSQIQVRPSIGLGFASVLRSILRHDPDIVLVGEIRDLETAEIAAQAALTGHLVLSTLHTNSAAASITRLLDMGVEDYLVTATVNGVAAQRLVRRLCESCRTSFEPDAALAAHLGLERLAQAPFRLWRASGCGACNGTGYFGRTSLLETLIVDDDIRRIILKGGDAEAVGRAARAAGMRTLYEDGVDKALAGITSIEEVLRVTRDS
ncbi:MAG: GspE/PulE family protein [Rhodothalassiaceae bacterium]